MRLQRAYALPSWLGIATCTPLGDPFSAMTQHGAILYAWQSHSLPCWGCRL